MEGDCWSPPNKMDRLLPSSSTHPSNDDVGSWNLPPKRRARTRRRAPSSPAFSSNTASFASRELEGQPVTRWKKPNRRLNKSFNLHRAKIERIHVGLKEARFLLLSRKRFHQLYHDLITSRRSVLALHHLL